MKNELYILKGSWFGVYDWRTDFIKGFTHEGCHEIWKRGKVELKGIFFFKIVHRIGEIILWVSLPPVL